MARDRRRPGQLTQAGSSREYLLLFEKARDIILVMRRNGSILNANPAACGSYGYSLDELRRLNITDLRAAETVSEAAEQMAQADSPEGIRFETVHRRRDGTTFPVDVNSLGTDLDGERVLLSFIRDISRRRGVEAERERLLAEMNGVFASLADAVVVYDQAGNIVRMNGAAERMLRFSASESRLPIAERMRLVPLEMTDGRPLDISEMPAARALRGETFQGLILRMRRAGRRHWVAFSGAPLRTGNGQQLGAVVAWTDLSPVMESHEQRAQHVLNISHGLRTPLTAIHGHAQLMLRTMEREGVNGELMSSARAILAGSRRMSVAVRNLVDLTELEASRPLYLNPVPLEMDGFLRCLLSRFDGAMDTGRVRLDTPAQVTPVLADPDRLERVVAALLDNALRYSETSGFVTVKLDVDGDQVVTSISDFGAGIPKEQLRIVFEPYAWKRSCATPLGGLGIGLYLARGLVEAQGGRMWASSEVGKGSTFSFSLPVAK